MNSFIKDKMINLYTYTECVAVTIKMYILQVLGERQQAKSLVMRV